MGWAIIALLRGGGDEVDIQYPYTVPNQILFTV